MEDPVAEIPHVIHLLTQSTPSVQRATIERYFTPDATFTHPFCRTGSFNGSRWLIWCIYRWYKIMSPRIELGVESVAYDAKTLQLYVSIHQVFRIFIIPFFSAPVRLVTVLQLVDANQTPPHVPQATRPKYLIVSQNDLYQVNEFVKFFSMARIVWLGVLVFQFMATAACVVGALLGTPISWVEENMVGGNAQRSLRDVAMGWGAGGRKHKLEAKYAR